MSQYKVQLPPEKVADLKQKYGLSDEVLQEMLNSLQVRQPGPDASLPITAGAVSEEENDPFMNSLATLAKKGGGEMAEVMAYSMLMDIQERREDRREDRKWKAEQREKANSNTRNPESEAVKSELSDLKETVNTLVETMKKKEEEKTQKEFAEGVVTNVTSQIMPTLQALQKRVDGMDTVLSQPNADVGKEMKEAIEALGDKLATKVSGGKITVDDFEPVLSLIDRLESRFKKGESGSELDWRNVAVNTLGEIGKEVVATVRDIETTKAGKGGEERREVGETKPEPPMHGIIKRQLQNYILSKLQAGATQLNIPEAAQQLGLTEKQVFQAYQALTKEGWFKTIEGSEQPERTETEIRTQEPQETEVFKRTEAVFTA